MTRIETLSTKIYNARTVFTNKMAPRMGLIENSGDRTTFLALQKAQLELAVSLGRWLNGYRAYQAAPTAQVEETLYASGVKLLDAIMTLNSEIETASPSRLLELMKGVVNVGVQVTAEILSVIDAKKILGDAGWLISNIVPIAVIGGLAWLLLPRLLSGMATRKKG